MSSTTQAANVAATTPVALLALAEHIIDHRLHAPAAIGRPHVGERELQVLVDADDLDHWLATLHVSHVTDVDAGTRGKVHRTHHARLDNGIGVALASLIDDPNLKVDEFGEPVDDVPSYARYIERAVVNGDVL